jgi:ribonuclease HII
MDGGLKAPKKYKQKTIIKGDEKISLIAAASIIAKVSRDRRMIILHKKFPKYRFDKHKGYGTKLHYKMLKKYGPCKIHRKSYNISIW